MGGKAQPNLLRWLAIASHPDPGCVRDAATHLARETDDWDAVTAVARAQGLLPALRRLIRLMPPDVVPAASRNALETRWKGRVAWSALAVHQLGRVLDAFEEEGIRTLALKGPALAMQLYGDPAGRPYGDLDLLVGPARRRDAARVLEGLGYEGDATHPARPESMLRLRQSVSWPGPHGIEVDLHWGFEEGGLRLDLERRGLWRRAEPVTIGGRERLTIGELDLVVYLAVHGGKHLWQRRLWLSDLARLVHVRPGLDWGETVALARSTGTARIVACALLLAERLAGAKLPDEVRAWANSDPRVRRLARLHTSRLESDRSGVLPSDPGASVGPWRWIALDLAQLQRPRDKARGLLAWFLEVSDPGWDASGGAELPRGGRLARVVRYLARDLPLLVPGRTRAGPRAER